MIEQKGHQMTFRNDAKETSEPGVARADLGVEGGVQQTCATGVDRAHGSLTSPCAGRNIRNIYYGRRVCFQNCSNLARGRAASSTCRAKEVVPWWRMIPAILRSSSLSGGPQATMRPPFRNSRGWKVSVQYKVV